MLQPAITTDTTSPAAVIADAAELASFDSNPPALPQDNPSIDDLPHTQADGNQDAQQHARRFRTAEEVREDELEEEAAIGIKVWPCGCDEAQNHYLENFATFQRHVRDGLKNLPSQDVHYNRIEALMVYWKGGDVPEVADKAKELGALFEKGPYNFTVTPLEIDYKNLTQPQINDSFGDSLREVGDRIRAQGRGTSNLLILYYGGHGVIKGADRLWQPKEKSVKNLIWSNYQSRMYDLDCDILYLFDCCYSLAMVETPSTMSVHRRRCEIFCSSGLKELSGSGTQDRILFTGALREFLAKKRDAILERRDALGGLTFEGICDAMTQKNIRDTLIAEPRWRPVAPNPALRGRITIIETAVEGITPQPGRNNSDSGYESEIETRSQLSDTRVLIKIRLTNPANGLSSDDWLKWFEQRPHNVAHIDIAVVKSLEWVGVFESDSSLALLTIPLWLWHNMEQDPACESLGIVRSKNLLRAPVDDMASAVTIKDDNLTGKVVERKLEREQELDPALEPSSFSSMSLPARQPSVPQLSILKQPSLLPSSVLRRPSLRQLLRKPLTAKVTITSPGGAPYRYSPIAANEIRVFVLKPGFEDDPLEGDIMHLRPRNIAYDFLSYARDSNLMTHVVIVNGKELRVSPTLQEFLRRLRSRDRPLTFWADALCIDLKDLSERARLAPQWPSIISGAEQVRVWLGNADEDTELAFDEVARVAYDLILGPQLDAAHRPRFRALERLMRRPWFSRRWKVQEIAYAKAASIYCGPFRAGWSNFANIVSLYASASDNKDTRNEFNHSCVARLVLLCENIFRQPNDKEQFERLVPLDSMVCILYDFQTVSLHDTIYALLSLAKGTGRGMPGAVGQRPARVRPWEPMPLSEAKRLDGTALVRSRSEAEPESPETYEIDYAQSFTEVAVHFVLFTISTSKSLDIICRAWAPVSGGLLPSWIKSIEHAEFKTGPDGSRIRCNAQSLTSLRGLEPPRYSAGGSLQTIPTVPDDSGTLLTVQGFTLGNIALIGQTAVFDTIPLSWLILGDWDSPHDDYPARFWRTLVGDRGLDGLPPPRWYGLACERIFKHPVKDINLAYVAGRARFDYFREAYRRIQMMTCSRRLMKTSLGGLGLVPEASRRGDLVCILRGCSVPVILRPKGQHFELVGECFVHGMMDGEALELDLPEESYVLE